MIASLNIVAKTFARLLAMIIATRRRHVLILHLEAKYAKMDCKNEIYVKNKATSKKVNPWKKATVKLPLKSTVNQVEVNSQSWKKKSTTGWRKRRWHQRMMQAKMTSMDDASKWCQQLVLMWQNDISSDISKHVTYRGHVAVQPRWEATRGGAWRAWLST